MIRKEGVIIDTLELWEARAGPRSEKHWADDRSAKESARAWLASDDAPRIPSEILALLSTHGDFGEVKDWTAEPECLVAFDGHSGPANIDVMVSAADDRGPFVIAVEAKADETFGALTDRVLSDAVERSLENPASRGVARAQELAHAILGPKREGAPALHQIRYQLLTATAAALSRAKADGADRAVLIVHEFRTRRTEPEKHATNERDLSRFLLRLGVEEPRRVAQGELLGPLRVPGGGRFRDPPSLYVGKATRTIEPREASPGVRDDQR
jgi:hypothetical protein